MILAQKMYRGIFIDYFLVRQQAGLTQGFGRCVVR
ncbi:hypothetical protein Ga0466249_001368 [Sporomusaceae bacterium BoRhaA]|nr:hypothetical protein [Pelorhabdus rhamnosifermentans]